MSKGIQQAALPQNSPFPGVRSVAFLLEASALEKPEATMESVVSAPAFPQDQAFAHGTPEKQVAQGKVVFLIDETSPSPPLFK